MAQLSHQGVARRPTLTLGSKPKRQIDDPPDSLNRAKPTDVELPSRKDDPEHPEDHPDSPPRKDDSDTTEGESEQAAAERDEARQELKDLEQNR